MNMLHEHVILVVVREHNHRRFDSLVDVALAVGWGQDDHARISLAREPIDAIVIVLVEHPKFKLLNELGLGFTLLAAQHGELNRRIVKYHVELKFDYGLNKADEVWRADIILEHIHRIIIT